MADLRAAVIGAGRLGSLHAHKYRALEGVELKYVADVDQRRADEVAAETGAEPCSDYRDLRGKIDLATVASPGVTHHLIAADLMRWGIDVLLEKPMAATLDEAHELGIIAAGGGRILQIGHLERFNPAIERLGAILDSPRFIECHRLASFTERGTDVDVVLDLMVHDLDVILSLVQSEAVSVEAVGVAVLTDQIDIANARIRFANGLIANLNSSRVSAKRERKIRFFQPDAYLSVDYEARSIQVYRKSPPPAGGTFPVISAELIGLAEGDPLMDEVRAFVNSVRARSAPRVSADDGLRVMELSERIRIAIAKENAALNL
ncbi:MAG TPA: Gfo/Idh/MocA family oxidoreductase [Candidatus Binataceae bacterium]|nr:Gfo/Idh/MocA family oxidoreductase [Candidatus Binataceae bacterium]